MDVIREILKHLPVCELKRFSTVSKQWKYVIREILHPALENAMRNKVLCYAHTITKDYEFKADVVSSSANSDVAVVKLLAERINLFHPEEGFELRIYPREGFYMMRLQRKKIYAICGGFDTGTPFSRRKLHREWNSSMSWKHFHVEKTFYKVELELEIPIQLVYEMIPSRCHCGIDRFWNIIGFKSKNMMLRTIAEEYQQSYSLEERKHLLESAHNVIEFCKISIPLRKILRDQGYSKKYISTYAEKKRSESRTRDTKLYAMIDTYFDRKKKILSMLGSLGFEHKLIRQTKKFPSIRKYYRDECSLDDVRQEFLS